jgi:hypothetical protein
MPKKAAGSSSSGVAAIDSRVQDLIADIDAQIGVLQQRKNALVSAFGGGAASAVAKAPGVRRRGRPPGSLNKAKKAAPKAAAPVAKKRKKRVFSAETKAKLAASKKAYWDRVRAEKATKK